MTDNTRLKRPARGGMMSNEPEAQLEQARTVPLDPYGGIDISGLVPLNIGEAIRSARAVPDFVLPGLLAGSVAVVVGPGGVSKSMLAVQTGAVVGTGRDHWSLWSDRGAFPQGRVVVFNIEDPLVMIGIRAHDIGHSVDPRDREVFTADFNRNVNIWSLPGRSFRFATKNPKTGVVRPSEWIGWMEDQVRGCRLAIIDTFIRGLGGLDENSSTDVAEVLGLLEGICRRTGCAIMILHHVNKGSTGKDGAANAQQAARGSSAITDNARWQVNLSTMSEAEAAARAINDDRKRWVQVDLSKVNYAAPMEPRWLHRGDGGVLSGEIQPPPVLAQVGGGKKAVNGNGSANGSAGIGGRRQSPPGPDDIDNQITW